MPPANSVLSTSPEFDLGRTLTLAKSASRAGNLAQAALHFSAVLTRFPANTRARRGLRSLGQQAVSPLIAQASELQNRGRLDEAEAFWVSAMKLNPDHADLGLSLAQCRLDLGRLHDALEAVDHVLSRRPDHAGALDTKGRILRDLGRITEAEACHKAALGQGAADAGPLNHLGILEQARGRQDAAADYYRRALSLRPDLPDLHNNLARCTTYSTGNAHLKDMLCILRNADPDDAALAPLHFALFKACDELEDRAQAFKHLVAGNRLRRSLCNFDIRQEALRFAWYKSLSFDRLPAGMLQQAASPRPIFIVGLPRSGTTLVERILGQCEDVQKGGELSVVSTAVAPLLRQLNDEGRTRISAGEIRTLRDRLLHGLAQHSDGSNVLVDKMPLNFRWIGPICEALPEARIVSLSRAPMPVAWSLYRHLFASRGNGFAYDMADIAAYQVLHHDMMRFWSGRYQERIIPLRYSDIVTDSDPTIRRLVGACELNWTEACLTPHSANSAVLTASAEQVQKPIYANSDDDWRQYQDFLAPLSSALRDVERMQVDG